MAVSSHDFEAMGTTCHLLGIGPAAARLETGVEWVTAVAGRLTRFDPGSELSRLNAAAGTWAAVGPELEAVLREALRAHELSGGLVHAGVLNAVLATGYTRPLREGLTMVLEPPPGPPPPLPEMLEVEAGRARVAPGTGVDLGGLATGWMADRLAERLGDDVVVNLGGDLFARGPGPDGRGWPIGVAGEVVELRDVGAATSGLRRTRWGGVRHLIDPRTGRPAESDLTEASVVAGSATAAEVLAKAALLLGSAAGRAFLESRAAGWVLR